MNPDDDHGRKEVTEEIMANIFSAHGPSLGKGELAKLLLAEGFKESTCYRNARLDGPFKDHLWETNPGRLAWK